MTMTALGTWNGSPILQWHRNFLGRKMSITGTEPTPWGLIQWALTGLATATASAIAFSWRLIRRVDSVESAFGAHSRICRSSATANEAAILRLTERLQQVHDDQFRIRETIGSLPTRSELRDVEDRIVEQLSMLASRLDRTLERRDS